MATLTEQSKFKQGVFEIIAESGIEPKSQRRLMHHSESDCVFEISTDLEFEACLENGCDDVTGLESFEKLYQESKKEEERTLLH